MSGRWFVCAVLIGGSAIAVSPDAGVQSRCAAGSRCTVELPGGAPGIGFDDFHFAPVSRLILVPAGRSGRLDLVKPDSLEVKSIEGFTAEPKYEGGHDQSVTSADEGSGFLFATDRSAKTVSIIDPSTRQILSTNRLAASPDYVRFVPTHEIWVTEPDAEQIEIFQMAGEKLGLLHTANIPIAGGPESLVVDPKSGRAFTHLWKGATVAIDLRTRSVGKPWKNGCTGSRGIAFDSAHGWVITGCAEGGATVLDAKTGALLSTLKAGAGVDVIDYDEAKGHVFLGAGKSGTLEILKVGEGGKLSSLASVKTAAGAHCVASDRAGRVYVCDPSSGRVLVIPDVAE